MKRTSKNNIPKCGYIYVAIGEVYIKEAIVSARSLKKVDKEANITLVTNKEISCEIFDKVIIKPIKKVSLGKHANFKSIGFLYKTYYMYSASPYDRTLFVDTDTYFYENPRPLFKLLDYADIIASSVLYGLEIPLRDSSYPIYESLNSSIIIFKKNAKNKNLFQNWLSIYKERLAKSLNTKIEGDQTSFTLAYLKSNSKIYLLPNMWNMRLSGYTSIEGSVKMVHGRGVDFEKFKNKLNKFLCKRGWDPIKIKWVNKRNYEHRKMLNKLYVFSSKLRKKSRPYSKTLDLIKGKNEKNE